jgi:hypothetical protein
MSGSRATPKEGETFKKPTLKSNPAEEHSHGEQSALIGNPILKLVAHNVRSIASAFRNRDLASTLSRSPLRMAGKESAQKSKLVDKK